MMGILWDIFCDVMDPMSFNASDVKTERDQTRRELPPHGATLDAGVRSTALLDIESPHRGRIVNKITASCAQGHEWPATAKVIRTKQRPCAGVRRTFHTNRTVYDPPQCPECGHQPMGPQKSAEQGQT